MKVVRRFRRLETGIVYLLAACRAYLFAKVLSDYLERNFNPDLIYILK